MRFDVHISKVRDPYWNLAAEEWFLDRAHEQEPVLFLWQSRPTVVIGKNQNPWRECDVMWMAAEQIDLARRISGGGAVYHDEGNLNYAFFMPREAYTPDDIYELVIAVLAELGVEATRWNRTSLMVNDQKVSGNAFCLRRNVAMHHGTLLINADRKRLSRSLKVPDWQITTKATASVPAPVQNLAACSDSINVERVVNVFIEQLAIRKPVRLDGQWNLSALTARVTELRSDTWLFDRTPPFEVTIPDNTGCYNFSVHSLGNTEVAPPVHAKQNQLLQQHSGGTCSVTSSENRPKRIGNGYKQATRMAVEEGRIATSDRDSEWIGRPFREWVQHRHVASRQRAE